MTEARQATAVAAAANAHTTPIQRPLARALAQAMPGAMLLSAGLLLSPAALAASWQVTNLNDSGSGSLRDAISQANSNPGADTITFASSVSGSIDLTTGPLYITDSLDVQGPGASILTVDGSGIVATPLQGNGNQQAPANVFTVGALGQMTISTIQSARTRGGPPQPPPAIDVTLSGLTISGGHTPYAGGGILATVTNLSVNACTVTGNSSQGGGGIASLAKYGEGSLSVADSVISNNSASFSGSGSSGGPQAGGGILAMGGTTSVSRSSISSNTAVIGGGLMATPGKYNGGTPGNLTIANSTISGNQVQGTAGYYYGSRFTSKTRGGGSGNNGAGGGLASLGNQLSISNSTISSNSSGGVGGGMALSSKYGTATSIGNSTVAGNQAAYYGGGIAFYSDGTGASPQVRNSVIGSNSAASNADLSTAVGSPAQSNATQGTPGTGFDLAFSLVQSPGSANIIDSGGNIFNQAPMLGAPANNGGPTLTQLPLAGSPLINAGDPSFSGLANDQRGAGYERIVGSAVDIGAVEYGAGTGGGGAYAYVPVPGLGDAGKLGLGALLGLAGLAVARRRRKLAPVSRK